MRVKVGDKIFDSEDTPVMVILSEGEKGQITNMGGEKYCVYPDVDHWTKDDYKNIKEWMAAP